MTDRSCGKRKSGEKEFHPVQFLRLERCRLQKKKSKKWDEEIHVMGQKFNISGHRGEFIALINQEDTLGGLLPNQKLIAELDAENRKKAYNPCPPGRFLKFRIPCKVDEPGGQSDLRSVR